MPILPRCCIRRLPIKSNKGKVLLLIALALALGLIVFLSLRFGSREYSAATLWNALFAAEESDPVRRILLYARLPRTVAALLAGMALALSGVLMQAVLNNPMASPNVIGVNSGAGFLGLLAAVLIPGIPGAVPAAAFLGALSAALIIYLLARRAGLSRTTLVLAGIAMNAILNAGVQAISLLEPEISIGTGGFMVGGFSGVTLADVAGACIYLSIGFLLAAFLANDLNVLQLGEESAAGLGLPIGRVRFLAILAAALLAGGAVSFAGLLSFVGLLVPHMARRLIGNDNRWLYPAAMLLGGGFVLGCDTLARVLFAPFQLPVGIVLSLLGGPFFLSLLLRQKRRR